jgi:hypothetical protein
MTTEMFKMKKKERFYAVTEVGYITIEKKSITNADVFIEMKVMSDERKTDDNVVMVFTADQITKIYHQLVTNIFNTGDKIQQE